MIIDSHCHYNLTPLLDNWAGHWMDAQAQSVSGSVVVGTSVKTSSTAIELAVKEPRFLASVGIHPNSVSTEEALTNELAQLETLATNKAVCAIGECGLDYFRLPSTVQADQTKYVQRIALEAQFKLAKKLDLPLIIHLRDQNDDAYWDFFAIFKQQLPLAKPLILHCVSGPRRFVSACLDHGVYLGAAGNVTYQNSDHVRDLLRSAPKSKILVETDAPYLPPQPHRGEICQPAMIQLTSDFLETELSLTKQQVLENTVRVFPQFGLLL